jgi:hypothetical protein
VHVGGYVDLVLENIPEDGYARHLDEDTVLSPGTGEAALRAAGAIIAAVDDVMAGTVDNAFCAVRPPGHHAEPERGMGFCLFNNVAIGAIACPRRAHDLQEGGDRRFRCASRQRHPGDAFMPRMPDTLIRVDPPVSALPGHRGRASETGVGNLFNAPLDANAGGAEFRAAMEGRILPALRAFQPEIVLVSAGIRRPCARPAGVAALRGARLRVGDGKTAGNCRENTPRDG